MFYLIKSVLPNVSYSWVFLVFKTARALHFTFRVNMLHKVYKKETGNKKKKKTFQDVKLSPSIAPCLGDQFQHPTSTTTLILHSELKTQITTCNKLKKQQNKKHLDQHKLINEQSIGTMSSCHSIFCRFKSHKSLKVSKWFNRLHSL